MRPILMGDIIAAARVLLEHPVEEREAHAAAMIYHARIADKVRKRTGRPHRLWGNGSLMAAARLKPTQPEPFAGSPDYLAALMVVTKALLEDKRQFGHGGGRIFYLSA